MAKRRSYEISDEKFKEAIKWLEEGGGTDASGTPKPGTKKGACEILGVSSNATMEKLILEWQEEQVRSAELRKKKRGTGLTDSERAMIVEAYLQSDPIKDIAGRIYRSESMVKAELERLGANLKFNGILDEARPLALYPPELPEAVVSLKFEVGDLVWVAAYQCIGEIKKKISDEVYRVYLLDEAKQMYVHQYVWDLGSTKAFQELGVNIKNLGFIWSWEQSAPLIQEALVKARKMATDRK